MDAIELKIERIKRRINLKTLSSEIHKSIGWLSSLENNRVKLTPKIIIQYMTALKNIDNNNSGGKG